MHRGKLFDVLIIVGCITLLLLMLLVCLTAY